MTSSIFKRLISRSSLYNCSLRLFVWTGKKKCSKWCQWPSYWPKNDDENNIPRKAPSCQSQANTMSDVKVDIVLLYQIDKEHQIFQNLDEAISERLASVFTRYWPYVNQKFIHFLICVAHKLQNKFSCDYLNDLIKTIEKRESFSQKLLSFISSLYSTCIVLQKCEMSLFCFLKEQLSNPFLTLISR